MCSSDLEYKEMVEAMGYRVRRLFVAVFVAGSALAGCRGGSGVVEATAPGRATGREPIVLGAVTSLSGPAALPDASAAAAAVFAEVNDDGGVRGHPIDYRVVDDRSDPEQATAAAARLGAAHITWLPLPTQASPSRGVPMMKIPPSAPR